MSLTRSYLLLPALAFTVTAAQATIINVPGDEPTIQAGIDAAMNGDEVVVAPGTYFETIDFLGKAITLRSSDGADVTIIDGSGPAGAGSGAEGGDCCTVHINAGCLPDDCELAVCDVAPYCCISGWISMCTVWASRLCDECPFAPSVVTCASQEGPDSVLDGFTITGGSAAAGGGGMLNLDSSPTVKNCNFVSNTAPEGGGMYNNSNSPTVSNCRFVGNTASIGGGGGMYNLFSTPTVTDCEFIGNVSIGSTGGGMRIRRGFSPVITNCLFVGNSSFGVGGGLSISAGSTARLKNCTIAFNQPGALYSFQEPGGIGSVGGVPFPTLENCIVWQNQIIVLSGSVVFVEYSDVQGGWPGIGNIDADPLFVDPDNGDYRLQSGSPAIDAGHNWVIAGFAETDLDGNPRFVADPADFDPGCGIPAVVDMGAYEFQIGGPFPIRLGDIDGDGTVGIVDFLALLADWGPCAQTCCLADLSLDGFVGIADFLTLLANWG